MKLSKFFLVAMMVGSLAVLGCGDGGSAGNGDTAGMAGTAGTGGGTAGTGGGMSGGNCADADEVCANCEGQQENDCRADVFACNQFDKPGRCEACIEETNPGCP